MILLYRLGTGIGRGYIGNICNVMITKGQTSVKESCLGDGAMAVIAFSASWRVGILNLSWFQTSHA